MYQLAVLGNPIEHSLSPAVFELFAKQCGVELDYGRILAIDETDFSLKVKQFFANGGTALNVTSPFKQIAFSIANTQTVRSRFCRAANFLYKNSAIVADTTDGIGLIIDMEVNRSLNLADKTILIIGSGFVLDSILLDMIPKNPQCIDILARNTSRTDYLAAKYATGVFDAAKRYDIILNSSPNIVENTLFEQLKHVEDNTFCYDITYAKGKSLFLTKMHILNSNSRYCNGLGMLVEQAKIAFIKLFAKVPDTDEVFKNLAKMGYYV